MEIDSFDRKILRELQAEPQLTMADLAERVGLSHTPCWRRLRRMEEAGIVRGRPFMLDPVRLGYPVSVFAHIRIRNHDEEVLGAFESEVCLHPEIAACYSMSGDSDYVLRVLARSIDDYERFLKKVLLHLPGVGSVNSSFVMKELKQSTDVPV
jgi:Lrp/AsnC family transcriptional regulator